MPLFIVTFAGWVNRHRQEVIDYVVDENPVLKGQLSYAGVPQAAIVRLEAETHSPTLSTLARYASAIGVDLHIRQPV